MTSASFSPSIDRPDALARASVRVARDRCGGMDRPA
jgi:hypothetical protein